MLIGIGYSSEKDSFRAAREAALLAKAELKQEDIDLAFIFCSIHYNPENVLKGIKQILPDTKIVGCSGKSIMMPYYTGSNDFVLLAIKSKTIKFGISCVSNVNEKNARTAGQELARKSLSDFKLAQRDIFIMLSDGLIKNSSDLILGVQDILGKSFPVIGGAASDELRFSKTFQYCQNNVFSNAAIGVLFGSLANFGFGIKHGWRPLGKPRKITKSEGNIIETINDEPAIKMYQDYFDQEAQELFKTKLSKLSILYPIGINVPGEDEFIIRNVLFAREDGALICQGDVPVGSDINLMIGSKDFCIQAAKDAAYEAKKGLKDKPPSLIIVFDSISRNRLLGRSAFDEIRAVKDVLGTNVPLVGFYSYGETSPLKSLGYRGASYFHNATIAILAVA